MKLSRMFIAWLPVNAPIGGGQSECPSVVPAQDIPLAKALAITSAIADISRSPHTSGRALWARTIIPHARGHRARVGGTILFHGVFQPGGQSAVTARPDPAKPSRSASLEWG